MNNNINKSSNPTPLSESKSKLLNQGRNQFFYTYVLLSKKDNNFYVGSTDSITNRMKEHSKGRVTSTKNRRPLKLIYYEACNYRSGARKREKYFKTSWGKRFIKTRIQQ